MWQSLTAPRAFDAPRVANDGAVLRATPPPQAITWVGHATLLVQVDGVTALCCAVGLLGRPASESGRLCQGTGAPPADA